MDLERIKQNFRIRSGRTKSKKKSNKPTAAPSIRQRPSQPNDSLSNGTSARDEQVKQEPKQEPKEEPKEEFKQEPEQEPKQELKQEETEPQSPPQEQQPEQKPERDTISQTESVDANDQSGGKVDIHLDDVPEQRPSLPHAATGVPTSQQEQSGLDSAAPGLPRRMTEPHFSTASPSSEAGDFDLNPPKPRPRPPSIERLAELLFSSGHLNALLHHPPQLARFSTFLQKYLPQDHPLLSQYLETQKAIKAVEYANAVAEGLKPRDTGDGTTTETRKLAATLDPEFEAVCNAAFKALVGTALPQWITYQLIKVCSDCLTNEITGRQSTPIMRDLVGGLSEVFCLTDPNQDDNPIIYASEEFYRLTGYGEDDVIGSNCRFLQGRKTNCDSPRRLKEAIDKGEEVYETLLNYRRDGRPFINVLMVAPLHDNNGRLKYHIGAQVDVTGLVEGGRALDGFQRYLNRRNKDQKREERELTRQDLDADQRRKTRALARLRDLSEMFDLEESAVVQETSRANSRSRDDDDSRSIASVDRQKTPRRVLGDFDLSEDEEDPGEQGRAGTADWILGNSGNGRLSGKLPGIYDSFMLFRPYPSLKIVFVSPKLRKLGNVLQTPLLSHVAAPGGVLNGLTESLKASVPVSAKLHFMPERGVKREGTKLKNGTKHEDGKNGRAIWVSCTPLLGSDGRVGVWMCVIVEKLRVGTSRRRPSAYEQQADGLTESFEQPIERVASVGRRAERPRNIEIPRRNPRPQDQVGDEATLVEETAPIKPVRINSQTEIKPSVEKSREPSPHGEEDTSSPTRVDMPVLGQEREEDRTSSKRSAASPEEQSNTNNDVSASRSRSTDADPRAVRSPIQEYQEPVRDPVRDPKVPSVASHGSGSEDAEDHDQIADEYGTTRSPTMPSAQNGRVLIEEDSDMFADGSSRRSKQSRTADSHSPSPVWSHASEIPPSIPSDAQLADEDEDVEAETLSRTEHSLQPPAEEPANKDGDHWSRASSAHQRPAEPEAKALSPAPLACEKQSQHHDEDEEEEDETLVGHTDTDAYADEQPAEMVKKSRSSGMRMDYLRAGSGRWQQGRNSRRVDLTELNLSMMDHGGADGDDRTTDADCARSPYSVD